MKLECKELGLALVLSNEQSGDICLNVGAAEHWMAVEVSILIGKNVYTCRNGDAREGTYCVEMSISAIAAREGLSVYDVLYAMDESLRAAARKLETALGDGARHEAR